MSELLIINETQAKNHVNSCEYRKYIQKAAKIEVAALRMIIKSYCFGVETEVKNY
jgi:hypothetical protein